MAGNYSTLRNKKRELMRKGLDGSAFIAALSADPIGDLTAGATKLLNPLPAGYDDAGWLTGDGPSFAREVAQSDMTSWGSNTPTRTDITSDVTSVTIAMQETKALTIGVGTGADPASLVPDSTSGELRIDKPAVTDPRSYRLLTLAVDRHEGDEIYIARFLPAAKVTNYAEQSFAGEDGIGWGVTFTGEEDSDLGYSESWIFGGPGWFKLLDKMGFDTTP